METGKKGIAISFSWIFAIVVGAVILFIAGFVAVNLIKHGEYEGSTKTAVAISNLLDPLQTSSEEIKAVRPITLEAETRIKTSCNTVGDFGENRLQISERSKFSNEFDVSGGEIPATKNQYVFAEDSIQGDTLYFFVKPLKMPFKVADLVMVYTQQYCFVNAPSVISDEIDNLMGDEKSIVTASSVSSCDENSVRVCFVGSSDMCDVVVNANCDDEGCVGIVYKDGEELKFSENLIYAAIFSSADNYECGVDRLMMRIELLSEMYLRKVQMVIGRCNSGLGEDLEQLHEYASRRDLRGVEEEAKIIDEKNEEAICQLY